MTTINLQSAFLKLPVFFRLNLPVALVAVLLFGLPGLFIPLFFEIIRNVLALGLNHFLPEDLQLEPVSEVRI
ncbi:MAG: hypothetical protein H6581_19640 [Bacteroidia bacterium]|nr:hypothetical protein [Bacteroidia bacterium]